MQTLDPISFPLNGASLIEASAGTGKTYTIVNLYLRMLLGHGCQALDVEQILVVTFTKAATAELKARIRQKLSASYYDFVRGESDDPLVKELINTAENLQKSTQRLAQAIRKMDDAAVYTIHSFCQRVLVEHAFESGVMYEQSLILDESQWLKLATEDYWRKFIVPLPAPTMQLLLSIWRSPEALQHFLRPLLYRKVMVDDAVTLNESLAMCESYTQLLRSFKTRWLSDELASQFQSVGFKKNTKLGKEAIYAALTQFCLSTDVIPTFDKAGWSVFDLDSIAKALPKGKSLDDLAELPLAEIQQLDAQYKGCKERLKVGMGGHGLVQVKAFLMHHKSRMGLLSPDDLLSSLESALTQPGGQGLCEAIRRQYPAALIDEFQDTDPAQFTLFDKVFIQANEDVPVCLIMIGDPKQAIYAFRGADIFTYIDAKQLLPEERHFTLSTNWRSQPRLVNAINQVFATSAEGFMFKQEIPFVEMSAAKTETPIYLENQPVSNLAFRLAGEVGGSPLGWASASHILADDCANQIARFIQHGRIGDASIDAGDCCVLVRDRDEAALVKAALSSRNIASVFLIRKSVFASQTAIDLYLLLTAIANPKNDKGLKAALCTDLIAMTASELDALINDELAWQNLVDQFFLWQQVWQRQGVMTTLLSLCEHFDTFRRLVTSYEDGLRRVTDLRHLCELLQQQSIETPAETQLLHWYAEILHDPDHDHEGQQLRLETDANLVQIVTMHASKGLEFPLVFIPFACRFRTSKTALYHDSDKTLRVDFNAQPQRLALADYERIAEDTRLFYVALTRAVYYCCIGLWDPADTYRKTQSVLAFSALGKLLSQNGQAVSLGSVLDKLVFLSDSTGLSVTPINDQERINVLRTSEKSADSLPIASLTREIRKDWRVTSYSAISRQQSHHHSELPGRDEGLEGLDSRSDAVLSDELQANQFSFTKGAQAGSFLHGVLENIDFDVPSDLAQVIEQQGLWFGIEQTWFPVVHTWLINVLGTSFSIADSKLKLSDLKPSARLVEMEFHMPLKQVSSKDFNSLINAYSQNVQRQYDFEQLNGMLKGFIDLTFEYQGRFYVADYKSNHLGDSFADYQPNALLKAMEEHDYHLQAIIYVLALHRWLKVSLPDYSYDTHIGGAYYLFLRGMSEDHPGAGVYHMLPEKNLIMSLDALFDGENSDDKTSGNLSSAEQLDLW